MRQVNLTLFGGPRFTLTGNADQFLVTPAKGEWPPELRPILHGGMTALHLSIPLTLRRDGPDAGTYWIHLKYPDGLHEPVAALSPETVERFFVTAARTRVLARRCAGAQAHVRGRRGLSSSEAAASWAS